VSAKSPSAERVHSLPAEATAKTTHRRRAEATLKVSPPAEETESRNAGDNDSRGLVQTAYEQLNARKQAIEAELARIEALRAEHETVAARVTALEEALKSF